MHGICSGTWMHGCMDVGMIVAWLRSARMHEWKGAWLHDAFFALGGFIVPRQYKMVCQFPNGSASPNILPVITAPHAQKCADLLTAHPVRKIVPNSHGPGSANVLPICSRPTVQTLRTGWAVNKSAHFRACGAVNKLAQYLDLLSR